MNKISMALSGVLFSTALLMSPLSADAPNPYDFNVFATQNIGSPSSYYGSDFQGIAGAAGSVYFSGFQLNTNGTTSASQPYSLFTGGSTNFNSGQIDHGGISSGGSVNLNSTTVNGNVSSGGGLSGNGGQINGNVSVAGSNTSSATVNGSVSTGVAYTPTLNLNTVSNYFKSASSFWAGLSQTSSWANSYGQIQVAALSSGRNIVNLNYSDLAGVYGIALSGGANSFVVFNINNVPASGANLQYLTLNLSGGITSSDVLINLGLANSITINGGSFNILAPNTDIQYNSGALNGSLVAQNLNGSGQVNSGGFSGYAADQNNFNTQVPEPSTYAILGSMLAIGALAQRRRLGLKFGK